MKKIGLMMVLFASMFMLVISAASDVSAQGKSKGVGKGVESRIWDQKQTRRTSRWSDRTSRRRNGPYLGYRNYGQYRRTQVGNRRYRMVRRSYWSDGRRLTRMVRSYY